MTYPIDEDDLIVAPDNGIGARRHVLWSKRQAVGVYAACVACGWRSPTWTLNRYSRSTAVDAAGAAAKSHNRECAAIESARDRQEEIDL